MLEQRDSRVARILRDARAAVAAPLRPETPRDATLRPAKLQGLQITPIDQFGAATEALRRADTDESRDTAARDLRTLIDGGDCDIAELRRLGIVDACVRALEKCEISSAAVISILACLRQCEFIPGFASALFTGGSLPVVKKVLDRTKNAAVAGGCLILTKMLSADFAHAFVKFDLLPTLLASLAEFHDNEVVIFAAVGSLSKAVVVAEVSDYLRASQCEQLLATVFCSHKSYYVRSRALFVLTMLDGALGTVVKRNPLFIPQIVEVICEAGTRHLPHGVLEYASRVVLVLSNNEKFCRRHGNELLRALGECVTNGFAAGLAMTICLSAISNITFYGVWFETTQEADTLIVALVGVLFGTDDELCVEATRALGNITHHIEGCGVCVRHRVHDVLTVLCEHADDRIVYNSLGALINLTNASTATHESARLAIARCFSTAPEIHDLVDKLADNLKA